MENIEINTFGNGRPENVTTKTNELVRAFEQAKTTVARAEAQLKAAQTQLENATNVLGRFMCPEDAQRGETFQLWYGDGILAVTLKFDLDRSEYYDITWRKQPSPKVLS